MPRTIKEVPEQLPPEITSLSYMFAHTTSFNQDLSKWDVSNVTNMSWMFLCAFLFNGDISSWDTSNVTNMNLIFPHALKFNQDLSKLNVSNVMKYEGFSFDSGIDNSKKLSKFKKIFNNLKY